jgi:hypothetical protein
LSGVRIEDGTTLLEKISGQIEVDELHPSWLIFGDGFRLGERHWYLRRVFSTLLALALCLVTAPFIPIIALIVKLSSPGPVLYRQQRVGLRGKAFTCYKFRTMRQDAEAGGAKWATDDDPRITRTGNFMRRTRMDEIPQFWNVLRGDMAFVGPASGTPRIRGKTHPGNSLLLSAAHGAAGNHRLGAGELRLWIVGGRIEGKASLRSCITFATSR